MDWNAMSAIGTTLAATVGVVGICLNLNDKTKKLRVNFETVPTYKIHLSNDSLRTVKITKMVCSINTHIFHVEYFQGMEELVLQPAIIQSIDINKKDIHDAYCRTRMCAICSSSENVLIVLYDNLGRRYPIKTGLDISAFAT